MKTCQNCNARSKDDVVECVHCGNLFGERPDSSDSDGNQEDAVKQTLFGIPAQKLEELLATQSTDEAGEDLSKKTMAGFNISGLFGDQDEAKAEQPDPVLPPVEDEPVALEDDIPEKIQLHTPQKTMAGLNVSGLFNKEEGEPELPQEPEAKDVTTDEDPKFGTMLGISVADIMGQSGEKNTEPTKTLFSRPTFDALSEADENKKSDTAGFRAAPKTNLSSFDEKTPSKASLGSLLPKVALQKKGKIPIIAARADVKTPVEFTKQARELAASQDVKSNASGIIRKSKSGIAKNDDSKKKSGVVGSYTIGKDELTSDSVSTHELDQDAKKTQPNITPETLMKKLAVKADHSPGSAPKAAASLEKKEAPVVETEKRAKSVEIDAGYSKTTPSTKKEEESPPTPSTKKDAGNYKGSITTIQNVFVIGGALIILGTIAALFSQEQRSTFDLAATSVSLLTLLGSLFALFGSKNDVLKGSVWSLSAILLIAVGGIGFFLSTPLTVLFIFAGALFLISALFPKIVSIL